MYVDCGECFAHATLIVRSGGLFWLKPVAMMLFMLCSAVLVEWLLLKHVCDVVCDVYWSSVFSSVFAITERNEMGLYDVPMFMSLFGFGIGMMLPVSMYEG